MYLTDNELSILSFSLEKFNSSIEEIDSTNAIVNIIIGLEALTNLLSQNELTSSEEQIDLVKKIYNCIDIESKTKLTNDIKSTFGKLKKKNIQDQIIYLLRKANQPLNIMEMSFAEFIKKCYQIRSDIVHAKKEYLISNDSISANVTRMKKELTTITRNFLFMYFYEKEVKG
jgi:CII-binding regulator of phage lambda lysogenization HflD